MINPFIGFIVGHDYKSKGAISFTGISEYEFNRHVADSVVDILKGYNCEAALFTKYGHNYREISELYLAKKCLASFELHFNSYTKVARGLEILIRETSSVDTWKLADIFSDHLSEVSGIKERHIRPTHDGILPIGRNKRGDVCLKGVFAAAKHTMLIEPAFCNTDNPDSRKIFGGSYPTFLAEAVAKTFDLEKRKVVQVDKNYSILAQRINEIEQRLGSAKLVI